MTWYEATRLPTGAFNVPIGYPMDHVRVHILDDKGMPPPPGVAGEIHIGGNCLARGYWMRPGFTAEQFVPDPFARSPGARLYRTGDLGRWNDAGALEYVGRRDGGRKIRGIRVEPTEIEAALQCHPSVLQAAVCVEERRDAPQLIAYVLLKNQHTDFEGELRGHLRQCLPDYLIPSSFVSVNAMPQGPTGKVDRRRLTMDRLPSMPLMAPEVGGNPLERQIAKIWAEVLGLDHVGFRTNFFDLGGDSLGLMRLRTRISNELGRDFRMTELIEHPTIEALAAHVQAMRGEIGTDAVAETAKHSDAIPASAPRLASSGENREAERVEIAVVGMSGRFPMAGNLETFWKNLSEGRECRTEFSDAELKRQGLERQRLNDPNYVKSGFVLDDVDHFDAAFFGMNPREAEILDPQHRLALECAWETLEDAGYDPEQYDGTIGLFCGATMSGYLLNNVLSNNDLLKRVGHRQAIFGSVPDYLVTRISYKLNLKGPSCFVQTACSTSLVAVHLACQCLQQGEADLVLAGGVSVYVPQRIGYLYEQGGMESPDGRCYTFDERARGTVFGSGAGMVALKRLSDAVRDGDRIDAVIKGSAINNDGSLKVGFTAPSVTGQADVIHDALADAGVPAASIGYVEAHGTSTELGDPIEVAALSKAFEWQTDEKQFCAIGSVKPNIGHLDAAAGISGLIKVVLSLRHQQLPPSINFRRPNPKIDFANTPLYVNTKLSPWTRGAEPRRAGVSSFGFGGTNAHVIVEEPPSSPPTTASRSHQLVVLSARTEAALDRATENLAERLRQDSALSLADTAYTLQVGRAEFSHRRVHVCRDTQDAVEQLSHRREGDGDGPPRERPIVFMFPGQGAQHVNMSQELYRQEPVFREIVDQCCDVLSSRVHFDLRETLYPREGTEDEAKQRLTQTSVTQVAVFVVEFALARLWMSWGIRPSACIGHSIGEYTAACLAGVFSLEDALNLVATRGQLMEQMPRGAMLAIPLGSDGAMERIAAIIGSTDIETRQIGPAPCLAAINAPAMCVVSGESAEIDLLHASLSAEGLPCQRLQTSHAFHSPHMDAAIEPFVQVIEQTQRNEPTLAYVSNVTGDWVTREEIDDPHYWGKQLRQPVQFSAGIQMLLAAPERLLLEVGPGQTLSTLARQHLPPRSDRVLSSLPHPTSNGSEVASMLHALGELWLRGSRVDWRGFHRHETRRRVALPTYPFERKRYWVEPPRPTPDTMTQQLAEFVREDVDQWFYVPTWKRVVTSDRSRAGNRSVETPDTPESRVLLLLSPELNNINDDDGTARLRDCLESDFVTIRLVAPGDQFAEPRPGQFTVRPGARADHVRLWQTLRQRGELPQVVVHAWCVGSGADGSGAGEPIWERGFEGLIAMAQAIGELGITSKIDVTVLTRGLHDVMGHESVSAANAAVLGPCRVIPQEYVNVSCVNLDLPGPSTRINDADWERLRALLRHPPTTDRVLAIRHGACWRQTFEAVRWPTPSGTPRRLRDRGVYLITGGLGGVGRVLGRYLADTVGARLVLTSRTPIPSRESWPRYLASHPSSDKTAKQIGAVQELEAAGAEVWVATADVCDAQRMRDVIEHARRQFGRLDGVIHAAGVAGGGVVQLKTKPLAQAVLAPKVTGTIILGQLLKNVDLDFFILASSITSILGQAGQVDYTSANAFMDAFASEYSRETGIPTIAINWSAWKEVGMAVDTDVPPDLQATLKQEMLESGLSNADAVEAFARILEHCDASQVAVIAQDLSVLAERSAAVAAETSDDDLSNVPGKMLAPSREPLDVHPRPPLPTAFRAAQTDVERAICKVWADMLGMEPIGIDDSFFELGGHSLLAVQVMTRINQTFQSEVPVARLYEGLTVSFLAGLVENQSLRESKSVTGKSAKERQQQARRQRQLQQHRRSARRKS